MVHNIQKEVIRFLPSRISEFFSREENLKDLTEIRIRTGRPLVIHKRTRYGEVIMSVGSNRIIEPLDISEIFENMCENSVYAFREEIRNGFITLKGGHRVGIVGNVVTENGQVKSIRDICGINIRILREVDGCSKEILDFIKNQEESFYNTLVLSPPGAGKTTILRDIARSISNGDIQGVSPKKVGIVDERGEIASCYNGVPQNNVGVNTDIISFCPKTEGIIMLLRSMSPEIIITDEIGSYQDKDIINDISNAGIKIIASAHGFGYTNMKMKKSIVDLLDLHVFERLVVLSKRNGPGTLEEVVDLSKKEFLFKR